MSWGCPWALCALLIVPLVYLYLAFFRVPPTLTVASVSRFRKPGYGGRFRLPRLEEHLLLAALALLIVALARPRLGNERVVVRENGVDMLLALDMSGSMIAYDPPPDMQSSRRIVNAVRSGRLKNRFDTAKRELERFAANRPGDRIGLIGFADFAYRLIPPTTDRALLSGRLKTLEPRQLGDGTNLASPIVSAVNRLKTSDSPRRVLVLFTDGVNNMPYRVTPEQAAEMAKEYNIIIHTVGIGGSNAVIVADTPLGTRTKEYPGEFDGEMLSRIASITGGEYFRVGDADGMRKVMDRINMLERTEKKVERFVEYREYGPGTALAALVLFVAGVILGNTWKLRLP